MSIYLRLRDKRITELRRGYDYYWSVMRRLSADGASFTLQEVTDLCDLGCEGAVYGYLRKLRTAGYVEVIPDIEPATYRLLERPKRRPFLNIGVGNKIISGKAGPMREYMWNVMRRNRDGWTVRELALSASTSDVVISTDTARHFVNKLFHAGMLLDLGMKRQPDNRYRKMWRLKASANTGPLCPVMMECKAVYDRNTRTLIGDVIMKGDGA